jgi:hypothetical protein
MCCPFQLLHGVTDPFFFQFGMIMQLAISWVLFSKGYHQWYQYGKYLINGRDNTNINCWVGRTSYLVIGVKNIKLSSGMLTCNAIDVYCHLKGLEEFICPDNRRNRFLWNVGTRTRLHSVTCLETFCSMFKWQVMNRSLKQQSALIFWHTKIYQANSVILLLDYLYVLWSSNWIRWLVAGDMTG